jgi:hypothetical protein
VGRSPWMNCASYRNSTTLLVCSGSFSGGEEDHLTRARCHYAEKPTVRDIPPS